MVERYASHVLSRTQTTVSLSTAEAELAALTSGVTDAMLVESMLSELGVEVNLKAWSDSSSALAIAKIVQAE